MSDFLSEGTSGDVSTPGAAEAPAAAGSLASDTETTTTTPESSNPSGFSLDTQTPDSGSAAATDDEALPEWLQTRSQKEQEDFRSLRSQKKSLEQSLAKYEQEMSAFSTVRPVLDKLREIGGEHLLQPSVDYLQSLFQTQEVQLEDGRTVQMPVATGFLDRLQQDSNDTYSQIGWEMLNRHPEYFLENALRVAPDKAAAILQKNPDLVASLGLSTQHSGEGAPSDDEVRQAGISPQLMQAFRSLSPSQQQEMLLTTPAARDEFLQMAKERQDLMNLQQQALDAQKREEESRLQQARQAAENDFITARRQAVESRIASKVQLTGDEAVDGLVRTMILDHVEAEMFRDRQIAGLIDQANGYIHAGEKYRLGSVGVQLDGKAALILDKVVPQFARVFSNARQAINQTQAAGIKQFPPASGAQSTAASSGVRGIGGPSDLYSADRLREMWASVTEARG